MKSSIEMNSKFMKWMEILVYVFFPLNLLVLFIIFFSIGIEREMSNFLIGLWLFDYSLNTLIKYSVRRKRPSEHRKILIRVLDYSFPSWHTESTFAIFTGLILFKNNASFLPLLIVPVLVGYNRVYLKQHYLSDVVAGTFLGITSAIVCYIFRDIALTVSTLITYWFDRPETLMFIVGFVTFAVLPPVLTVISGKVDEKIAILITDYELMLLLAVAISFGGVNAMLSILHKDVFKLFVAIVLGFFGAFTAAYALVYKKTR